MDIDTHPKVDGYIYAYHGSEFPYANNFDVGFMNPMKLIPMYFTRL